MSFIFLRNRVTGGAAFTPASLFSSGEEGAWYEPSTTTCFTATWTGSAFTDIAAAGYGDFVAIIEDQSGNGNDATQTDSSKRPILARVPEGGRRNLLEKTEQFDNDTYWSKSNATIADADTTETTDPNGTNFADKYVPTASISNALDSLLFSCTVGSTYTLTLYAKPAGRDFIQLTITGGSTQPWATFDLANEEVTYDGNNISSSITDAGNGWKRCVLTGVCANTTFRYFAMYSLDGNASTRNPIRTGDGTNGVYIFGAQCELASTATAYQRVVDEYDITEAGVTSLEYLAFDGTDDFLINDAFSVPRPVDVFTAYLTNDAAKNQIAVDTRNSTDRFYIGPNNGQNVFDSDAATGDIRLSLSASTPYVFSALGASPSGDDLRIDGVSVGTRTGGTHGFDGLTIGDIRNAVASGYKLDGNLYGLIVRGAASTAQEISDTESYVANLSGVSL